MPSPGAVQAANDALAAGKAVLKFISRNNVGDTGSHECGYYLPKNSWTLFTKIPPKKGTNGTSAVKVVWGNGRETQSNVKWYGKGTRNEYRLTTFGRDFEFLDRDNVGSLLVLIPFSYELFHAYVLDTDEDIESVQTALGVELLETIAVYERGITHDNESEDECVERHFREITAKLDSFPTSRILSDGTKQALEDCIKGFKKMLADRRLLLAVNSEYRLFKMLERKLCSAEVTATFRDIDDFLQTAQTILQRRKGRAGLSFQNHVRDLLSDSNISFSPQPLLPGNDRPDFILPNKECYEDQAFPEQKLIVLAVKTTCKDRWRQVLEEAPRLKRKHILTLQPGISVNQLRQMQAANITLVVPNELHNEFNVKESGIDLLSVSQFIAKAQLLQGR